MIFDFSSLIQPFYNILLQPDIDQEQPKVQAGPAWISSWKLFLSTGSSPAGLAENS